jgi:hypothetical protein
LLGWRHDGALPGVVVVKLQFCLVGNFEVCGRWGCVVNTTTPFPPRSAKLAEMRTWVQAYISAVSNSEIQVQRGEFVHGGFQEDKGSHHNRGRVSGNKAKIRKFTHLFEIVISKAPRGASSTLGSHAATLLTAAGRAEVGSVGAALGLRRLGGRWCRLALESLHLLVKLGGKLLIFLRKFANAILRNPVVPAVEREVLLVGFLVATPYFVGCGARTVGSRGKRFSI